MDESYVTTSLLRLGCTLTEAVLEVTSTLTRITAVEVHLQLVLLVLSAYC